MKSIAHVITTIERGGAENQLLILAREQCRTGVKVTIIPLKGATELVQEFTDVGAIVNHSLLNKRVFFQWLKLGRILRHFELAHAHLPRAELLVALIPRTKFIFTRHNTEQFFPGAPKFFSNLLSRFVVMRSCRGIAISNAVRRYLITQHEISPEFALDTILYGIPTSQFPDLKRSQEIRLLHNLSKENFIIGTVARLAIQKDLPTLLRAFSIVLNIQSNARLIIIGVGPEKLALLELATELGVDERIIWVGKSPEIAEYLSLMNVFVLSSLYEGFGLVLAEAMVASCPIVAANNSAIPEVIGTGHLGLAETSNPMDFAQKLLMMRNPEIRQRVLEDQESRLKTFSPEKMSENVFAAYEKCFESNSII
jgi:glycosyltransferase involved in cell wall biosynthesis